MSEQAWIALATLAFLVVSGFFGWLWGVIRQIGNRLTALGDKADANAARVTANLQLLLDTHERRDEDRHVEVVQRLTRVETIVINGHGKD